MMNKSHESHLRHEHKTQGDGGREDDKECQDEIGGVWTILDDEGHRHPSHAHDHHVVHTHSDVFGVVQSWHAHVARLPSQETTKDLQKDNRCYNINVTKLTL